MISDAVRGDLVFNAVLHIDQAQFRIYSSDVFRIAGNDKLSRPLSANLDMSVDDIGGRGFR